MTRRLAVHAVTRGGAVLGARVAGALGGELLVAERVAAAAPGARTFPLPMRSAVARTFAHYDGHVFVLAVGATVRLVAPLLGSKWTDPAVVCLDEGGRFAVALLSGHAGGANALAAEVAGAVGATPVVTTASDVQGTLRVDLLGRELGWTLEDPRGNATRAAAAVVNGEPVLVADEAGGGAWWPAGAPLPANVAVAPSLEGVDAARWAAIVAITDRVIRDEAVLVRAVLWRPRTLAVGVGCDRGASVDAVWRAVRDVLEAHGLAPASVGAVGTIDVKRDEAGIVALAARLGCPLRLFGAATLDATAGIERPSEVVRRHVGTRAVAEPAALLAARAARLLVPKQVRRDEAEGRSVTVAVARAGAGGDVMGMGSLSVVGLGPGALDQLTPAARAAVEEAEVVLGYRAYLDLAAPLLAGKELVAGRMTGETERAREAVARARAGARVALVSSGDAGVYGMASLVLEILRDAGWRRGEPPAVTIVPGLTALGSCAALAGAPLGHDFCAISLSDLLTPWEVIARRLEAAAAADFVVGLYNPASTRRRRPLAEAHAILARHRDPGTPVAVVTDAFRAGQRVVVTTLERLLDEEIGMTTTVIVGSSRSFTFEGLLVTPRGYAEKYGRPGMGLAKEESR